MSLAAQLFTTSLGDELAELSALPGVRVLVDAVGERGLLDLRAPVPRHQIGELALRLAAYDAVLIVRIDEDD